MVANVSESVCLDYLALKKKAVLASETSVTVRQSSQRNTHAALALTKMIDRMSQTQLVHILFIYKV